jgi:hypothetical protein
VLDVEPARGQDRAVAPSVVVALTVAAGLAIAACQGDDPPPPAPSAVEAFPDPPHVDGPITVTLRTALRQTTDGGECRADPDDGRLCSPDGSTGYRVIATSPPVVVDEVSTAPAEDRTSWSTTIRFADGSRAVVRRSRAQAAGVGGVVVVSVGDDVATVVPPADLTPRRAALLGLGKAEAWSVVDAFSRSK